MRESGRLDLGTIAIAVTDLTTGANAGKLTLEDIAAATFTVNNLSPLGVDWFTRVPNSPQYALLSVGRMRHSTGLRRGGSRRGSSCWRLGTPDSFPVVTLELNE